MKNVFKLIGIIALVAIIGFSMTACGKGSTSGKSSTSGGGETNGKAEATETQDKLKFTRVSGVYLVEAANDKISGAIVIPDTYKKSPVVQIGTMAFRNCNAITSVTIPASVTTIGSGAFEGCTSLTSVTFQGRLIINSKSSFPGDLEAKYKAAGTYTRPAGSDTWTNQ